MSSVEIEDVLSSIRRLVTEDLRPKPVQPEGKLILTPALRVVPDDGAAPEEATPAASDEAVLDVDLDADLAAALTEDARAEVDRPEDAPHDMTASADAAVTTADADNADNATEFPMFQHHARRDDTVADSEPTVLSESLNQIAAGIPAEGFEAELGDAVAVPDWPESAWVAPEVVDAVEEAELITSTAEQHAASAEVWAAVHSLGQAPEASFGTAEDDAAEAAALAALAEEEAAQQEAGLTELDEDMLREIVRQIIREELQGTLGERITRNVRKLVRAEINRALMTQDLE